MQITTTNTSPLGANGLYNGGPQVSPLDYPYLDLLVSSDQAGVLSVFESNSDGAVQVLAVMPVAANAPPAHLHIVLRGGEFYRVSYQNGAVAQTAFSLAITTLTGGATPTTDQRVQRLILRELRAISMLLISLKEPTSQAPNIPLGMDQITPA
jgi:hypothetical protein